MNVEGFSADIEALFGIAPADVMSKINNDAEKNSFKDNVRLFSPAIWLGLI